MTIPRADITGLVLAGGLGSRMGGVDKGLQHHQGLPLALHALQRLAPQVGAVRFNANRNLAAYEALGAPVWPDTLPDHPGPLAGLLAGLERCETPYLASVPCDTPNFPLDLVERMAAALAREGAELAYATTLEPDGRPLRHPVFCLVQAGLAPSLAAFLAEGERKVGLWFARHRAVAVPFADAAAFFNANTADDLRSLQEPAFGKNTGSPPIL